MTTKGYKQSPEHIEKRKRFGESHSRWKGDFVTEKSGRSRALRAYPDQMPCEKCGTDRSERHHRDGNTANNDAGNIAFLCRRCHMIEDGRLERYREIIRQAQPDGTRARWQHHKENGDD